MCNGVGKSVDMGESGDKYDGEKSDGAMECKGENGDAIENDDDATDLYVRDISMSKHSAASDISAVSMGHISIKIGSARITPAQ